MTLFSLVVSCFLLVLLVLSELHERHIIRLKSPCFFVGMFGILFIFFPSFESILAWPSPVEHLSCSHCHVHTFSCISSHDLHLNAY